MASEENSSLRSSKRRRLNPETTSPEPDMSKFQEIFDRDVETDLHNVQVLQDEIARLKAELKQKETEAILPGLRFSTFQVNRSTSKDLSATSLPYLAKPLPQSVPKQASSSSTKSPEILQSAKSKLKGTSNLSSLKPTLPTLPSIDSFLEEIKNVKLRKVQPAAKKVFKANAGTSGFANLLNRKKNRPPAVPPKSNSPIAEWEHTAFTFRIPQGSTFSPSPVLSTASSAFEPDAGGLQQSEPQVAAITTSVSSPLPGKSRIHQDSLYTQAAPHRETKSSPFTYRQRSSHPLRDYHISQPRPPTPACRKRKRSDADDLR